MFVKCRTIYRILLEEGDASFIITIKIGIVAEQSRDQWLGKLLSNADQASPLCYEAAEDEEVVVGDDVDVET